MAQQDHTICVVKPGGGMSMWERLLQPSGKLSRHGRLLKALEHHDAAKRIGRCAVHHACQEADKEVYKEIDSKSSEVYRLANQFRRENANVVGDKPVKNDAGEISVSEDSKQKAWLEHYQRLLYAEFDWDLNHLSDHH